MTHASWVDDALRLPVAFAQVREDPELDLALLPPRDGLVVTMVASGGCTAAALAVTGRVVELTLVDVNPAQLALAQLKLALLARASPAERRALLGHDALDPAARHARLTRFQADLDALGPRDVVMALGPDHAGRYERVFAELRRELAGDLARLDHAFDTVMALDNLKALFGAGASQGTRRPFARHFADVTRHALAAPRARENPFLTQVLEGRYPESARAPWLDAPAPPQLPAVRYARGPLAGILPTVERQDLIHLSNTLDWLTPDDARAVLERARAALAPGGWLIVRQLNSVLDIPALLPDFGWDPARGAALHARDRSFFYHAIHVGCRA